MSVKKKRPKPEEGERPPVQWPTDPIARRPFDPDMVRADYADTEFPHLAAIDGMGFSGGGTT